MCGRHCSTTLRNTSALLPEADNTAAGPGEPTELTDLAFHELERYFAGDLRQFTTPIAFTYGTPFQQAVWRALLQIPYGETRTYPERSLRTAQATMLRPVLRPVQRAARAAVARASSRPHTNHIGGADADRAHRIRQSSHACGQTAEEHNHRNNFGESLRFIERDRPHSFADTRQNKNNPRHDVPPMASLCASLVLDRRQTFVIAFGLFFVSAPQQLLMAEAGKGGGELIGGATVQIAFNFGNAVGSFVGPRPCRSRRASLSPRPCSTASRPPSAATGSRSSTSRKCRYCLRTRVSAMVTGQTVANMLGVPAGTLLAEHMTWRLAFCLLAAVAALTALLARLWIPYIQPVEDAGLRGQFRFLRKPGPWMVLIAVFAPCLSVRAVSRSVWPCRRTRRAGSRR